MTKRFKIPVGNPALRTWAELNAHLKTCDEAMCQALLEEERAGRCRPTFLKRIHHRLNGVRAKRERHGLIQESLDNTTNGVLAKREREAARRPVKKPKKPPVPKPPPAPKKPKKKLTKEERVQRDLVNKALGYNDYED